MELDRPELRSVHHDIDDSRTLDDEDADDTSSGSNPSSYSCTVLSAGRGHNNNLASGVTAVIREVRVRKES